jgi:phospholipid/cholesterol/gamma-HCH transport system ATP-binding protein
MSVIQIRNLHKSFGEKRVLRGVDLEIDRGETLVVVGKSGCGKSVMLKHIVRLLEPDEGTVTVEGRRLDKLSEKEIYEMRKDFGFLFQGAALFDSMTVEENVALPLVETMSGHTKAEIDRLVAEKLEVVDLPGVQKLKPSELSGGMKKRVGLARSLVTEPAYILYDEPTTGLDPTMSDSIDDLIVALSDRLNVTSIVVTHDLFSIKNVADRVAMLHDGRIHYDGSAQGLLESTDETIHDFTKRAASL